MPESSRTTSLPCCSTDASASRRGRQPSSAGHVRRRGLRQSGALSGRTAGAAVVDGKQRLTTLARLEAARQGIRLQHPGGHCNLWPDMNRLSYFRSLEKTGLDDGRADSREAVWHWLQPKGLVIEFSPPGGDVLKITDKDLAAPLAISASAFDHLHLFCLCAMPLDGRGLPDDIEMSDAQNVLTERMRVDDRCLDSGPFAVLTRADLFYSRCKERLATSALKYSAAMVDYYDDETFNGTIDFAKVPFSKQKRFSYQREYRLCVSNDTQGNDALTYEIGNISEFSAKMASNAINSAFELKLQPKHQERET